MSVNLADSEYSLQYFNFTPETFFKEFSELAMEEMSKAIQNFLKELASPDCPLDDKEHMQECVVELHSEWCDMAKPILNKLEPLIKDVFTIPKNVLLECDEVYKRIYSDDEVKQLERVEELEVLYGKEVKELSLKEAELRKAKLCDPITDIVDNAIVAIKPISNTVKDIQELQRIFNVHLKNRNKLCDVENDIEDDVNMAIVSHESKFKCSE